MCLCSEKIPHGKHKGRTLILKLTISLTATRWTSNPQAHSEREGDGEGMECSTVLR